MLTVSVSFMCAYVAIKISDFTIVACAGFLTVSMVVGMFFYAQSQQDEKSGIFNFMSFVYIFSPLSACAAVLAFYFDFEMGVLWSFIGVIIFAFYLLVDFWIILEGEGPYNYMEEGEGDTKQLVKGGHIKAAASIYLDIISIFVFIISLLE